MVSRRRTEAERAQLLEEVRKRVAEASASARERVADLMAAAAGVHSVKGQTSESETTALASSGVRNAVDTQDPAS